jgi:hypothetical protein
MKPTVQQLRAILFLDTGNNLEAVISAEVGKAFPGDILFRSAVAPNLLKLADLAVDPAAFPLH